MECCDGGINIITQSSGIQLFQQQSCIQPIVTQVGLTINRTCAGFTQIVIPGIQGSKGVGVPAGGTAGQILAKIDGADYNTHWINPPTGGAQTPWTSNIDGANFNLTDVNEIDAALFKGQYQNAAGSAYINPNGSAVFANGNVVITNLGAVTAATFNGLLATANISQFTNNAGYITAASLPVPGGADGALQYNNANAFGGFGSWDGHSIVLTNSTSFTAAFGESEAYGGYNQLDLSNGNNYGNNNPTILANDPNSDSQVYFTAGQGIIAGSFNFSFQSIASGDFVIAPSGVTSVVSITSSSTVTGSQIISADGTVSAPSFADSNHPNTGINFRGSGASIDGIVNGVAYFALNVNGFQLRGNNAFGWSPSDPTAVAPDTGLSRLAASILAVGDGGVGDFSGGLKMHSIQITASPTAGFVLTSDASGNGVWEAPAGGTNYWTASGNNIFNNNSGFVGINTDSPAAQLHVYYPFAPAPSSFSASLSSPQTPLTPPTDSLSFIYGAMAPASASSSENIGGSGYTCTGQTNSYNIFAYKNINGQNYISNSPITTSFQDTVNDGTTTFSGNVSWAAATCGDGSPVDGYWLQTPSGTIDVGNTLSYSDTGGFDGSSYPNFGGITAAGQTFSFDIYDFSGSYFSANGGTQTIHETFNNGSSLWIVHNITGAFTSSYAIFNHASAGSVNTTDNPYYQTAGLGGNATPTPQLIQSDGSTLNREYKVYGTDLTNDVYNGFLTSNITDPADFQWYYITLNAGGATYYKYFRNINGAGFTSAQLDGGSLNDDITVPWAASLVATPLNTANPAAIFENSNATFGSSGNAQVLAKGTVPMIALNTGSAFAGAITQSSSTGRFTILPSTNSDLVDIWSFNANFAVVTLGLESVFNIATGGSSFRVNMQSGRFINLAGFTAEFGVNTNFDSAIGVSIQGSLITSGSTFAGGNWGFFGASPTGQQSGNIKTGLTNLGLFGFVTIAASDVAGLAASATIDTTNASNISSGTLPSARLPSASIAALGGMFSAAAVTHQWISAILTNGHVTQSQPAFTDISGTIAATQLPNPSASTLGGVQSVAAVTHNFITSISTLGVPSLAQPTSNDLLCSATNDSGAAGYIGEYIISTVALGSAVVLISPNSKTVTSISLTAGDWDVDGEVVFVAGSTTTATKFEGGISQSANTLPTPPGGYFQLGLSVAAAGLEPAFPTGTIRISLASTTTIYLIANSTFATSTMSAYGFIGARRAR